LFSAICQVRDGGQCAVIVSLRHLTTSVSGAVRERLLHLVARGSHAPLCAFV